MTPAIEFLPPHDLKNKTVEELNKIATELRDYLIHVILENGGHFAANLGVIELTVSLLSVIDPNTSPVIWDVGHQSYPYKILTGRHEELKTIRNQNGISGFPKRSESKFDWFGTGHSSTALSAALGFAEAMKRDTTIYPVVAIIGDGALTGGMAYEAMNNMIDLNYPLLVVFNDNQMGIDPNTGALNKHLIDLHLNTEQSNKIQSFFEWFGFEYNGPIDGHNIQQLQSALNNAININKPQLIHIRTIKGKGYEAAEKEQTRWHSAAKFIKLNPSDLNPTTPSIRKIKWQEVFAKTLLKLADTNPELRGITPAMPSSCGMLPAMEKYPDRFFDVGISEQHAVTFAAGIAAGGKKVIVNIYSTFLQRAYDQIIHDVILQNLPILFCIDRAGLVGEDGPTHHGTYDMSFLLPLPNVSILAPYRADELENMMHWALLQDHPVFIRYPRGEINEQSILTENYNPTVPVPIHSSEKAKLILCSTGITTQLVLDALTESPTLFQEVDVLHFPTVKTPNSSKFSPSRDYQFCLTIEDGSIIGGFGQYLKNIWENESTTKFHHLGIQNHFPSHGSINELQKEEGFDVKSILAKLSQLLSNS